jgi:uncharacterized protein
MSLPLSQLAKSTTGRTFGSLINILTKAEAYAVERGTDEAVLLGWRLAPDMFPMSRQIQIASDISARGMARLAGVEIPSKDDTEKSFADLRERASWASAYIKDLDDASIDADPDGTVTFPVGRDGETMTLPRQAYLCHFILPNLYFHASTAYGLLRSCGVPLGKRDFLGG